MEKSDDSDRIRWPIWKHLSLGILGSGAEYARALTTTTALRCDEFAESVLKELEVPKEQTEARLVKLVPRDLGIDQPVSYDDIVRRAKQKGLDLCTAETGPALRLRYTDQPADEWINVAMQPVWDDRAERSRIFALASAPNGLWLFAPSIEVGDLIQPDDFLVFADTH